MNRLTTLLRDRSAASAAEFALVLPLLLLFLFGIIDAGRFMWEYNQAEKATQMGVRYAVATDIVPTGLADYDFATEDGILAGEPVPNDNFNAATCSMTECACGSDDVGEVCGSIGHNAAAFNNIVERMDYFYPPVGPANVEIEYRNVGLGYSGDPYGPDVAPMVTVRLADLEFHPITTFFLGGVSFSMPDFRASLTAEDSAGDVSN